MCTASPGNTYVTISRVWELIIYRDIITRPFRLFARVSLRNWKSVGGALWSLEASRRRSGSCPLLPCDDTAGWVSTEETKDIVAVAKILSWKFCDWKFWIENFKIIMNKFEKIRSHISMLKYLACVIIRSNYKIFGVAENDRLLLLIS